MRALPGLPQAHGVNRGIWVKHSVTFGGHPFDLSICSVGRTQSEYSATQASGRAARGRERASRTGESLAPRLCPTMACRLGLGPSTWAGGWTTFLGGQLWAITCASPVPWTSRSHVCQMVGVGGVLSAASAIRLPLKTMCRHRDPHPTPEACACSLRPSLQKHSSATCAGRPLGHQQACECLCFPPQPSPC